MAQSSSEQSDIELQDVDTKGSRKQQCVKTRDSVVGEKETKLVDTSRSNVQVIENNSGNTNGKEDSPEIPHILFDINNVKRDVETGVTRPMEEIICNDQESGMMANGNKEEDLPINNEEYRHDNMTVPTSFEHLNTEEYKDNEAETPNETMDIYLNGSTCNDSACLMNYNDTEEEVTPSKMVSPLVDDSISPWDASGTSSIISIRETGLYKEKEAAAQKESKADEPSKNLWKVSAQTGTKNESSPSGLPPKLKHLEEKADSDFNHAENDARSSNISTTISDQIFEKNPDSDVSLSFKDPDLSEEKGKIETCFQEDRNRPKSSLLVISVQREVFPLPSTDESELLVTEVNFFSQKCEEIYDKTSDNYRVITETPSDFNSCSSLSVSVMQQEVTALTITEKSQLLVTEVVNNVFPRKCDKTFDNYWAVTETTSDFISLEYVKKKSKAFGSKLHFTTNDKFSSFVPRKNSKKNAEIKIHLRGEVIHVPLDRDVALLKEKCTVGINGRNLTDFDLQNKKHYPGHNVLFSRNWFPLPRYSRDEIVGFVAEQTRDGHFGSTLPPAEHKELREILQLLASDNIPGPQITMRYEMLRLNTMKTFPGQDRPFAIRIVGAGFYYAGHQDQVVCYCCGNIKDGWVLGDIPLLIHQNMAPDCDFLTQNALVNVPIRKVNSSESPSLAEDWLLTIQRSYEPDQSFAAQGESPLPTHSRESGQLHYVSNKLQTVYAQTNSTEELQPKYPQFTVKNARINSFQGWPVELQQRPEEMAECGFYYEGFDDCVRCFHCGVGLRLWMSEDDPWIEHARWSASCLYVLKIKGEELVSLNKMTVEKAEREEAARRNSEGNLAPAHSQETAQTVPAKEGASSNCTTVKSTPSKDIPTNIGATGGDATGTTVSTLWGISEIQKYLLTDAAQSVLEMGFQPKLVQQAIERVFLNKGAENLTGEILVEATLEIKEETEIQKNLQQSVQSAECCESIGQGADEGACGGDALSNLEETQREDYADLCISCKTEPIQTVYLPCGDRLFCSDCATSFRICPVCKKIVKIMQSTSFC